MRIWIWVVVACACVVATNRALGAQPPAPSSSSSARDTPALLSRCAPVDDVNPYVVTPAPRTAGKLRRWAAGTLVRTSAGPEIRVVGRLVPSPNIAAQIGPLDPTIQSMAFLMGEQNQAGLGTTRAPLFPPGAPGPLLHATCAR